MLRIMFGTRTDSAQDPLVTKAMEIGLEFMKLTGKARFYAFCYMKALITPQQEDFQTPLTLSNHYSGFRPAHGRALVGHTMQSSMHTAR